MKESSKEITEKLIQKLKNGHFKNENIEQLLFKLKEMLKRTSGKKVYGYLKPEVKSIVNLIVDELEKEDCIKALYNLWYEQKDKITSNYTDEKLKRIPLSQNKEFKSIRNMVIKEAMNLNDTIAIFDDEVTDEPIVFSVEDIEPEPPTDIDDDSYLITSAQKYWKAKRLLDEESGELDIEKGFYLLSESAEEGNEYAQYRLGKMLFKGDLCDKDIKKGLYWLEQSVAQGNQWAEYFLGKQYLGNGELDKNYKRAIYLLQKSADQSNQYAQYTLGCQYLYSGNLLNKMEEALKLIEHSANQDFAPAEKMLAFIILKGELLPKNEKRAFNLLLHSAALGDDKAEYELAKLLLKSDMIPKDTERAVELLKSAIKKDNEWAKLLLGKMLLFGIDIPKDELAGVELLQSAAEQGNEYAVIILQNRENYLKYSMAISTMRLFGYIGNLFGKKFNTDKSKTGFRIDRKQYAQIQEKKMAHGLK